MRILITGICGFVGSTLAKALVEHHAAADIIGMDNFSRRGSELNRPPLEQLGIRVIAGDIRNASDVDALPTVDWVIDAAANPSVLAGVSGSSSRQLVEHNLLGTVNLLEFCKARNAGFVMLSTSRVYSIPPLASLPTEAVDGAFQLQRLAKLPDGLSATGIAERFSTQAPISLYGATKLASEQLALEYGCTFQFPTWINRCGVMAGAGQFGKADQGIFAFWLHSWREGRPLSYIGFDGQGHQVRDCLHPRDLAPLIRKQMAAGLDATKPAVVNLSGGLPSARSLRQLSMWCTRRWGERSVATDLTPRPFDLPWVVLDHSLATAAWDWSPATSTDAILNEIADFADAHPQWLKASA